jgi:mono/diheme cytochrome c family protein
MRHVSVFFCLLILVAAAEPPHSVRDGVYTRSQAQEGANLYEEKCFACHGEPETGGDSGPALAGEGFVDNWTGKTVGDLFAKVSTAMPMDQPGSLQADEYASLLAYIFFVNKFPAGAEDLPTDAGALRQIRVEPGK